MAERLVFANINIEPTGHNVAGSVDVDIARGASVSVDIPVVDRNNITVEPTGDDT